MPLLHINTFQSHLCTAQQLQPMTSANRAQRRFPIRMKDPLTGQAFHFRRRTPKVQLRALRRSIPGKLIPIKLQRRLTLICILADGQIDMPDLFFTGMLQGNFEQVLNERMFMHHT